MSTLTVLQLCQEAADELGIDSPSTIVTNTTESDAIKLRRYLTRALKMLAMRDWQILRREKTFAAPGTQALTNAMATDFLRFIPSSAASPSFWNRTAKQPFIGPLTPGDWQSVLASGVNQVVHSFYRRGGTIYTNPVVTSGDTCAYEYMTKNIVTYSATEYATLTNDSATALFEDDELIIMGLVWRYREGEGLAYAERMQDFEIRQNELWVHDNGPSSVLDMSGEPARRMPRPGAQDYTVTP